ncbi:hypothetical protein ACS0TY_012459 [Phlomoides rotata]
MNVGASVRLGVGVVIGGCLRREDGYVVQCFGEFCGRMFSVDIAEALAIRQGLLLARENGVRKIVVESDSQVVVHALYRTFMDLSYLGGIVWDILESGAHFTEVKFVWTRRQGNLVAHRLVCYAFSCTSLFFWPDVPDSIVDTMNADIAAIH